MGSPGVSFKIEAVHVFLEEFLWDVLVVASSKKLSNVRNGLLDPSVSGGSVVELISWDDVPRSRRTAMMKRAQGLVRLTTYSTIVDELAMHARESRIIDRCRLIPISRSATQRKKRSPAVFPIKRELNNEGQPMMKLSKCDCKIVVKTEY